MVAYTGQAFWDHIDSAHGKVAKWSKALGASDTITSDAYSLIPYAGFAVSFELASSGGAAQATAYVEFDFGEDTWPRSIPVPIDESVISGFTRPFAAASHRMRVRFVNGTTALTTTQISIKFQENNIAQLTGAMNQTLTDADGITLSRVINDQRVDIAAGFFGDRYSVVKFGANEDVGTGAYEVIWSNGGSYPWQESAETVRVKAGGNAADAAAGAGAQKLIVQGLDENWDRAQEEITLNANGTLASSATTTTFIRINRVWVSECGTYSSNNTGDIVIEGVSTSNVYANILAGVGQSQLGMYSIPRDYKGFLLRYSISVDSTKPAEVRLYFRENANDVATPFTGAKRLRHRSLALSGPVDEVLQVPIPFSEYTDLWFEAIASGGSATTVEVDFDMRMQLQQSVTPQ